MPKDMFEELFLNHESRLRQFCRRLTNYNSDYTEEVIQQCFLNLLGSHKKEVVLALPDDKAQLYLKGIAKNAWRQRFRKNSVLNNADSLDDESSPRELESDESLDDSIYYKERKEVLFKALKFLNELERKIIMLNFLENINLEEIAFICGFSLSYIKKKKAKALRACLKSISTIETGEHQANHCYINHCFARLG